MVNDRNKRFSGQGVGVAPEISGAPATVPQLAAGAQAAAPADKPASQGQMAAPADKPASQAVTVGTSSTAAGTSGGAAAGASGNTAAGTSGGAAAGASGGAGSVGGSGSVVGGGSGAVGSSVGSGAVAAGGADADDDAYWKKAEEDALRGTDEQIKIFRDFLNDEENRPESKGARAKREKRERSKRIFAAVGDGISALSNLWFTSKYAPNMYDARRGNSLSGLEAHFEKLRGEREKKRDAYMNYSLRLGDLQNARAKTLRDLAAERLKQKAAKQKMKNDALRLQWEAELQDDKKREQKGKGDKWTADAEVAKAEAENAPKRIALENQYTQAGIGQRNAAASASRAAAANSYASAGDHKYHFLGRTYPNKEEYAAAVKGKAKALDLETYTPGDSGQRYEMSVDEIRASVENKMRQDEQEARETAGRRDSYKRGNKGSASGNSKKPTGKPPLN